MMNNRDKGKLESTFDNLKKHEAFQNFAWSTIPLVSLKGEAT